RGGETRGQGRAWIGRVRAHGLRARTDDEYPTVTLTAEGRAVLRGDAPAPALSSVRVVSPAAPQPAAARDSAAPSESGRDESSRAVIDASGYDRVLFDELRALRRRLAE